MIRPRGRDRKNGDPGGGTGRCVGPVREEMVGRALEQAPAVLCPLGISHPWIWAGLEGCVHFNAEEALFHRSFSV